MMKIQGTPSFLGNDAPSVLQGAQPRRKAPDAVLSHAAEVFISKQGAKLQRGDIDPDDLLTPAEAALAADQKELEDKREKKSQAAEIEDRIASDKTLSDEDKNTLQKQADKLRKEGMTDEDKLGRLYQERRHWEKMSKSDTATAGDKIIATTVIASYDKSIKGLQTTIQEKELHKMHLRTQAVQERANLEAAAAKEQEKVDDAVHQMDEDEASVLETLLRYQAQRKAAEDKGASEAPAPSGQHQKSST